MPFLGLCHPFFGGHRDGAPQPGQNRDVLRFAEFGSRPSWLDVESCHRDGAPQPGQNRDALRFAEFGSPSSRDDPGMTLE
eukprot:5217757-Alexandrium_andersonii.AAC.1